MGGELEAYYWCYGATDFIMIVDFPDHTTVTGIALNIAASGSFTGNLTPLISVEEMDEMVKVSIGIGKPLATIYYIEFQFRSLY